MHIELWLVRDLDCSSLEHEADSIVTGIGGDRVQAQLMMVSNGTSAGLRQTDHVAAFEPVVAQVYL